MTAPHDLPAPYAGPPLTVAYLGNFRHSFCTEVHVAASMESLGHTVVRLQEDQTAWDSIPATVQAKGAQLFMWTRTWPSEKSEALPVLEALRSLEVPSAFFHLDRWHGLDREHQVKDQPFAYCDVVFSPNDSPRWKEDGFNHYWLPPGVYGPECEPVPPNPRRWPYDVVFVGSYPYPHPEWAKYRADLLHAFQTAFGRRFAILPRQRRGLPIRGRDLQELYATVPVVLGDSCLAGESHRYWSDRVPETLGRGGLLIHPLVAGMDDWYDGTGLDFEGYPLGEFKVAVDLARRALDNPEDAQDTRVVGRATVLARDTYAHRMGTVLAVAEGIYGGFRETRYERASPEVERDAGVSFSLRLPPGRASVSLPSVATEPPPGVWVMDDLPAVVNVPGLLIVDDPIPPRSTISHPPVLARHGRWSARFDLRDDEIGEGERLVIREVWETNDYRVPPEGFRGQTVVDIGANIGAFSVLAARAGARKVLAFEPDPSNYSRLTHHIAINRAATVEAVNAAVTDGSSPYVRMVGLSDGAHAEPSDDPNDIPTITLADIIGRLGKIDFIKCDTEGAEFGIFDAVPLELLSRVKRMALEWHAPVVTHLMHLRGDEFGPLVTKLADAGRVETFGHPSRGGLIWYRSY